MNALSITLEGLGKSFGKQTAVEDLNIALPAESFLVLLGPSGCGKTTTLRMIAGLEDPTAGQIRFGDTTVANGDTGASLPAEKRGLGMVFQSYALWPHMTVQANVEWPLKVDRWNPSDRRARTSEVLRMLGIEQLAHRYPAQLSGGQQQRVAIARTIAPRPHVLLFDEPLSNLDARLRVETRSELMEVHRASGATSVYVTHDQTEALAMATHIAVMKDGRLEQFGTPEELLQDPQTAFVAEFLGSPAAVLLEGHVRDGALRADDLVLQNNPSLPEGADVQVMYRPERFRLIPAGETTAGEDSPSVAPAPEVLVLESTPSAGRYVVTVRLGEGLGSRRLSLVSDRRVLVNSWVRMIIPATPDALFSSDGSRIRA